MGEAIKKILAYQKGPFVVTCLQSGSIPEDFLINLTNDERVYIDQRTKSPVEPLFFELLPRIEASGILSTISNLLLDVHSINPEINTTVDKISLPLAEDEATKKFLMHEYYKAYSDSLYDLINKTKQRFGFAHLIHLTLLPRFHNGSLINHEIVTFGEDCLSGSTHEPPELVDLYRKSNVSNFGTHTWIGINPKLFATASLRKELIQRLTKLKKEIIV